MRLQELRITNFRSCRETVVEFQEDITVLVGENGSGKSNIIDAIRLVTAPATGRHTLYYDIERDYNWVPLPEESIGIRQTFTDLTEIEKAVFIPHLVDTHEKLVYSTNFSTDLKLPPRLRISHTVGTAGIPDPEPESHDRIACVYLPPLRDAIRALDSADGNRLADVMHALGSEDEVQEFEQVGNDALRALAEVSLSQKSLGAVQQHLDAMTQPARAQIAGISYRSQRLRRLARALYMQMAEFGLTPGDLSAAGLGYANLLYIATVVIELERAAQFDLTLLLVEEPEAHLHPQLQSVLLSYLEARARESAKDIAAASERAPSGRIQIVVTTHSPNLASAVSTSKVVVVTKKQLAVQSPPVLPIDAPTNAAQQTTSTVMVPETITVPLSAINISPAERRKIDRYLTVTRAALLFARQVILVEGLAESLLVRTLAEQCILRDAATRKAEREQYRAISVIAIDGVDFHPYLMLLLGGVSPLVERVVVITDADGVSGFDRKVRYESRFQTAVTAGILSVHVGLSTLEADLFAEVGNESLLRTAFIMLHPKSATSWDGMVQGAPSGREERARYFRKVLHEKRLGIGKGDFAHVISELLQDDHRAKQFRVPDYLCQAIEAALVPVPILDVKNSKNEAA